MIMTIWFTLDRCVFKTLFMVKGDHWGGGSNFIGNSLILPPLFMAHMRARLVKNT